jgi:hypothetical protein
MLLGLVAFRIGKPFKYDGKTGKASLAEANKHMDRPAREGWKLDG